MALNESELQIINVGRKRLRTILALGVIVSGATLIYAIASGAHLAKEYRLLRSQPEMGASLGRSLLERHVVTHRDSPAILEALKELSGQRPQRSYALKLSKLEPKTETERTLIEALASGLSVEERLFGMSLFLLGWYGHVVKQFMTLVLFAGLGFFIGGTAICSYLTARPFSQLLYRLTSTKR